MPAKQRKIAIMGFRSVGKSSLAIQFVNGEFIDYYDPTVENTFQKTVKIQGQEYCLSLVDTRGQEEYSMFPHAYAIDIHGYCFVYSIDNKKSFEVIKGIYQKLIELTGPVTVPILLVGNKVDLQMTDRHVSTEEGKQLAEHMKAQFMEVSAKHNQMVTQMFNTLIITIERLNSKYGENQEHTSKCVVC